MQRRLCSVSIDLDPLSCYYRIHSLGESPPELSRVVLRRAVPRFLDVFARNRVAATFFVVGRELVGDDGEARASRSLITDIVAAGHEVANHSHSHPYEMARLSPDDVRGEVAAAHAAIAAAAGTAPVGFRAPGYDLSATMLAVLEEQGYQYDSSIFPAPGYYAAKAVVMGALAAAGRPSGAVLTDPRALMAPTDPYRPSRRAPWRRGDSPVVELPVAVTPGARLPAIGTNLLAGPDWLRVHLLEQMRRRPFFNLELHGIDLIDAEQDGIPARVVSRQPDLKVPLATKLRALEATLGRLRLDYETLPLREVAARFRAVTGSRRPGFPVPPAGPRAG